MAQFNLEDYATVQERIAQFYGDHPDGVIQTFLAKHDGPEVIFEARVFRTPEEAEKGVYTSGWAREVEGKTPVNRTSHLENCETSAVGRALANLGYATDGKRPSREEMQKVQRMEAEVSANPTNGRGSNGSASAPGRHVSHDRLLAVVRQRTDELPARWPAQIRDTHIGDLKAYINERWARLEADMSACQAAADVLDNAHKAIKKEIDPLRKYYHGLLPKEWGDRDKKAFQERVVPGKDSKTQWTLDEWKIAVRELKAIVEPQPAEV